MSIDPGQVFDYRFDLPEDHPPGVSWYHPHRHGTVADQLFGGLYGALIVEGDRVPVSRERVLVVSDISLTGDGQIVPVAAPEVMMGREETWFWSTVNTGRNYLRVPGSGNAGG